MNQGTYIDDVMADSPVLLTMNQTAKLLNVGRTSLYRLIERGELDAVRITLTTDEKTATRITNESVRSLLQAWSSGGNHGAS